MLREKMMMIFILTIFPCDTKIIKNSPCGVIFPYACPKIHKFIYVRNFSFPFMLCIYAPVKLALIVSCYCLFFFHLSFLFFLPLFSNTSILPVTFLSHSTVYFSRLRKLVLFLVVHWGFCSPSLIICDWLFYDVFHLKSSLLLAWTLFRFGFHFSNPSILSIDVNLYFPFLYSFQV